MLLVFINVLMSKSIVNEVNLIILIRVSRDQDVIGLDVAMNKASHMQGFQSGYL